MKDISAIHDSDEYEDQPFVILELVEVSHEPRIGRTEITTWTHKINGLTESDFILAAKIDQLYKS